MKSLPTSRSDKLMINLAKMVWRIQDSIQETLHPFSSTFLEVSEGLEVSPLVVVARETRKFVNSSKRIGGSDILKRGPVRGRDVGHPLIVSLEDLYKGVSKKMKITRNIVCKTCTGTGTKKSKATTKCSNCDGLGVTVQTIRMGNMIQQMQSGKYIHFKWDKITNTA